MSDPSTESTASQKSEPVVTVSQEDRNVVTAIERFDVPAAYQSEALEQAADHIVQAWKENPDFVAAFLLRDRNHDGVACYAQWKRREDGAAPLAPVQSRSLAAALPTFTMLDSRTYTVEFTGSADSNQSITQVSLDQTPFAHFGIFSVTQENQDRMLDLARENAPGSFGTPGLISINFHRSLDGLQVINLGTWSSLDDFGSLLQKPGFADDSVYWEGVAEFEPGFFDVILVETAQ